MRLFAITILFFFIINNITAQKQNNNWSFGKNTGISFNSTIPTTFTPTISTNEGMATGKYQMH